MVSVLASGEADRGFEFRSGQTKDYTIGICCFSAKHPTLRRKSKDWLARNQNNMCHVEQHIYPRTVCQRVSSIKIQLTVLVQYVEGIIII